ncbi:uncharacterized protein LOC132139490 [Carassius carassius]|uniref:uncharacterized protein LOC132139490 n=1 Tax=Carassius carassius TaxID=217509 RepID=UPI00286888F7|nr:uncharacterized protein LOC132139490 [Carassius carassius]
MRMKKSVLISQNIMQRKEKKNFLELRRSFTHFLLTPKGCRRLDLLRSLCLPNLSQQNFYQISLLIPKVITLLMYLRGPTHILTSLEGTMQLLIHLRGAALTLTRFREAALLTSFRDSTQAVLLPTCLTMIALHLTCFRDAMLPLIHDQEIVQLLSRLRRSRLPLIHFEVATKLQTQFREATIPLIRFREATQLLSRFRKSTLPLTCFKETMQMLTRYKEATLPLTCFREAVFLLTCLR